MVWQLPCVDDSNSSNVFGNINKNAFPPEIVIEAAEEAGTATNSLASSSLDLVPVSERLQSIL